MLHTSHTTATVVVVDDNPGVLTFVNQTLQGWCKPVPFVSGEDALEYLQKHVPDLIILDIEMPGMNGYEVLEKIRLDSRLASIPIIFFTALADDENELTGLTRGAVDYISKPVVPNILKHRIRTQLELYQYRYHLEQLVQLKTEQLVRLQQTTIHTLTELAESRDVDTGYHIKRTSLYAEVLARQHAKRPNMIELLNEETISQIVYAAPLHDVGKMAIPDAILSKPGKLTPEEFDVMKTHVILGATTIKKATDELGFPSFLDMGLVLCLTHHEKWNGTGYPNNLTGEDIALPGRILAIADVYDALTSVRPYKEPFSHEKSVQIILEGKGTHFDPDLVDSFLDVNQLFAEICNSNKSQIAADHKQENETTKDEISEK
ncbi:MAG: response regulator [Planctomycetaceae bacterium]|jgi:putative two-component system response regulator|nr:response regulator [Planctomycetaceae bacterium]